jgi:hypothetical protein
MFAKKKMTWLDLDAFMYMLKLYQSWVRIEETILMNVSLCKHLIWIETIVPHHDSITIWQLSCIIIAER